MNRARWWLRAGLTVLTLLHLTLAIWILFAPHSFYALPAVNLTMPYNQHLLLDFGAMNLAVAVMLAAAARTMRIHVVRTGLGATLTFWAAHFLIHLRYLDDMAPENDALLMTGLAATIVLPLILLMLTRRSEPTAADPAPHPGDAAGGHQA